jgi:hypothetical protein
MPRPFAFAGCFVTFKDKAMKVSAEQQA